MAKLFTKKHKLNIYIYTGNAKEIINKTPSRVQKNAQYFYTFSRLSIKDI